MTQEQAAYRTNQSANLFERAQKVIPGGVNSPVRAFRGVGGTPLFFNHGEGAWITDEDGNRYIDYIGAWGPLILGHRDPGVIAALEAQLKNGLGYGASTEGEVVIAETICKLVPSIEKVRLVTSGTEATMSAIRVARGYTKRDKVLKFEGCYHGHVDGLLVKAGSGALTLGEPDSSGVPKSYTDQTFVLPYNDTDALKALFQKHGDEIACAIVEPVAGNMNLVPPRPEFLATLREVCTQSGSVLIFDEVMTGFRTALGGAQSIYGITPDLTTLGKVIGGGLPIGAFGGKAEIMDCIAPLGSVYQAGTLAGSPLGVAAGQAMLDAIQKPGFYESLTERTEQLTRGLQAAADKAGIPFTTNQVGGMFGCFFTEQKDIHRFDQVMSCDAERFKQYFHLMLQNQVNLAPSAFEAGFVSAAHGDNEIELTIAAAHKAFAAL
ncbi:glutamate-1-semialdehyde 2,1-aminomutase [Pseudohongiella nitratireducens]|uniref:Glutamate-1-semialdehyde 2,1-aminomutase n=1 Tax=Pseudohongiella nitratireducens TaxID=1768907 RepID=A0A916QI68_9GAMM|nr:glutamate-1-semialdehyde 2,1-aminomutase [Pseudohongiella nitratireducens]GFZ75586.1 glutamate-1-semialdehyde 2,1-aminomutase [Pseudohongiella nitratireducens]